MIEFLKTLKYLSTAILLKGMNEKKQNLSDIKLPELPEIKPPKIPDVNPPAPGPEPLQMPAPRPGPINAPLQPPVSPPIQEIRPPTTALRPIKPHVYVKVSNYREIMEKLDEMSKEVGRIKNLVSEMASLTNQENLKIAAFNQVLSRIRDDLDFVEKTFTQPEE